MVSSCATEGLELSFRFSYSPAAGEYVVTEVVVSKIPPACDGQEVKVALSGRDMVVAAEGRTLFDADGGNDAVIARFDDSSPSVSAVTEAAVVISG